MGTDGFFVRSGETFAMKLGGRWLIPRRRLHQWLDDLPEASTEDVAAELNRLERQERRQRRRNGA